MSSVVTVTIDGKEVESCGSTMIFAEKGLETDVDFTQPEAVKSTTNGKLTDNTMIAGVVNKYKNYFGKSRVVVIQSQLGDPICAYSGDKVYWKVCKDLPKTSGSQLGNSSVAGSNNKYTVLRYKRPRSL